ncbi:hydroxysqualene dehydroxylase HpnE [Massilia norwichensis]|uniref:Hydroxysqualene dehydroxylase HpnE n=1 Tax=Massilia norwichensis TaxID=1442366 RepID=A0ABT2A5Y3_9BURK|nr:hydroxysqualene dehydroxylase HpnE [Massilia norwichensis]MCS0589589.1 hydroxysqualene dehydroxylase HpnE [Massilia norwichensis]
MSAVAKHIAVIGGGWAGCAAGVELAAKGARVTLFEAARTLGGRARAVQAREAMLDNGQHILLGAYADTLALLRRVGVRESDALLRLPLQMRYPPQSGLMDFVAPRLPAPLHMLAALLRARGLEREDKLALARFTTSARWMDWGLNLDCSVAELLTRFGQTPRLIRLMWQPLCLAALNTPIERASANVFLAVLRDSLGARRKASDMLLPRVLLDALFPEAARRYIEARGGKVLCGARVDAIAPQATGWQVRSGADAAEADAVLLATPAWQSAALLRALPELDALAAQLDAFEYEPISTVYLQYAADLRLPQPFCALLDDPAHGAWGQFVFDRGQLDPGQGGLLAVVVSAAADAASLEQDALATAVASQLAAAFRQPGLAQPRWQRVLTEKRATFACTPGLVRPANSTALPGLFLAGDYTAGDYPATLETAVRSGTAAARLTLSPKA